MKNVILCVTCVSFGALIGVLATRGHYRKLAFDEINEVRDVYRKKTAAKEAIERNTELKKQFLDEKSAPEMKKTDATGTDKDISEIQKRYSGGSEKHYNVFKNPPDASEIDNSWDENEDDPYEIVVNRTGPRDENSEPFEISEDDFASEKLFYDKVMIEYYNDGIAVLEDSGQIIESMEELIGPGFRLDKWAGNELYIRNDSRSTDYGILFTGTEYVPEEGLT